MGVSWGTTGERPARTRHAPGEALPGSGGLPNLRCVDAPPPLPADACEPAAPGAAGHEHCPAIAHAQHTLVLGWFRHVGLRAHDAEDCAQDTFLRFQGALQNYEQRGPLTAFLWSIARHVHLDWRRRQRVRGGTDSLELAQEVLAPEPLAPGVRLDLEAAVARLPQHLRSVVELGVRQGLPYREVGARLGIPEGTVKSRVYEAIRRLREGLSRG